MDLKNMAHLLSWFCLGLLYEGSNNGKLRVSDEDICDAFCDFGACGGTTSSAENATLNDVNKF